MLINYSVSLSLGKAEMKFWNMVWCLDFKETCFMKFLFNESIELM